MQAGQRVARRPQAAGRGHDRHRPPAAYAWRAVPGRQPACSWRWTGRTSGIPTGRCRAAVEPYVVQSADGRPAAARRRARPGRRHVVLVGGDPRLPAPGAGRRAGRPGRPDEPRHVRRAHPCARRRAGHAPSSSITPDGLEHVFLCDSGSVGVEVAIKMALQAQRAAGPPGAAPARDLARRLPRRHVPPDERLRPGRRHAPALDRRAARQVFAGPAAGRFDEAYAAALAEMVERHADELAAVIVEPVVQGAGGMRFHHPRTCACCGSVTDAHGVLLIFDEIATGFGRTGELFAADHAGVTPDIMCLGKALTGGYLTLAATLCTAAGGPGISAGDGGGAGARPDLHGQPAGLRGRERLHRPAAAGDWAGEVRRIERGLRAGLEPCGALPGVADVRVWARSAWCSSTTRRRARRPPPPRSTRGLAAPVPGPDLHHAAVRHGRRRRRPHYPRDRRRRCPRT